MLLVLRKEGAHSKEEDKIRGDTVQEAIMGKPRDSE